MENGLRVLIAGCDTFRAGAVEQLRTHTRHLNSLHPPSQQGAPAKVGGWQDTLAHTHSLSNFIGLNVAVYMYVCDFRL